MSLQVDELNFSYPGRGRRQEVFHSLSVSFAPGLNVLLGPNGAGKSTLLKCIFGLLRPDGHMSYDGESLVGLPLDRVIEIMAYLPQSETAVIRLSVLEVVLLGRLPNLRTRVQDEDLAAVTEMLSYLDILDLADRPYATLSGGQQKLVSIAQTLVRRPRLILMDEPTNSLDLQRQLEFCQILRQIVAQQRIDLVLAMHDLNLAARHADHLVVLDRNGRAAAHGTPAEVITEALLHDVYGVHARVDCDPDGVPVVSPLSSVRTRTDAGLPSADLGS
ncbi:MAG: ABC transporter ATP-binding protein [Brooklawnia sp.]